jgi:hypothetical protein
MSPSPIPVVSARDALAGIWSDAGLDTRALRYARFSGAEPVLASSFALGTALQAAIAACALAAASLWQRRGGAWQTLSVGMGHVAAEAEAVYRSRPPEPTDRASGFYRCGDGAWVCVDAPDSSRRAALRTLLACDTGRDALAAALARGNGVAIEARTMDHAGTLALLRRFAQWDVHEQALALTAPVLALEKTGAAPPQRWQPAARPLAGLRVLDLSDSGAGPCAARLLVAHGGDVIRFVGPDAAVASGSGTRGQRLCRLDVDSAAGRDVIAQLLPEADVLIAPAALLATSSPLSSLLTARRGLIRATFSAYGEAGPWAALTASETLVQAATGFCHAEALAAGSSHPLTLPINALEQLAGALLGVSILAAQHRRLSEGGDWRVRVSLARTGMWLRRLGRTDGLSAVRASDAATPTPMDSAQHHAAILATTPVAWEDVPADAGLLPTWRPTS